jgi:hypothetical protein
MAARSGKRISATIRAHLPRFRASALHGLFAGLDGHHQFARGGPDLRPLSAQRESSDVVGVALSDLEQRVALVFAEVQHKVGGLAGFVEPREALDVLSRHGSSRLGRGGLQVPRGAQVRWGWRSGGSG